MSYIQTGIQQPGIIGLLFYKGSSGKALSNLAQTLLKGPGPLSLQDRETIAAYVSSLNQCSFCYESHAAAAKAYSGINGFPAELNQAIANANRKLKSLLDLAALVQMGGRHVQKQHIDHAKYQGCSDEEIHDAVLIASAFCMFNRYVDGLGTAPAAKEEYVSMGERIVRKGYLYPPLFLRKFVIRQLNRKSP